MGKELTEDYKRKLAQERDELDRRMEDKMRPKNTPLEPTERRVKFEGKQGMMEIYQDWVHKYKKKNPEFKENENHIKVDADEHGGCIQFTDPHAEEDFVRHLAANVTKGSISVDGTVIASFEKGKLIDPRTNQKFPEGEYANLVQKLDSGIAYKDIPEPGSAAPNP